MSDMATQAFCVLVFLNDMTMRRRRGKEKSYETYSERETFALARKLAKNFKGDEIVFLIGELGAGKTVFAKGIAAGLGLKDIHQVCSPSFTLLNVYSGRSPIYHLDLYRLSGEAEIRDLGFEDYIGEGVLLIEWAEKITFPMAAIRVHIEVGQGCERRIRIME